MESRKKKFSFKPISNYTYSKFTKIQSLINNLNTINNIEDANKFHERIKQRRKKCISKTKNNLSINSNSNIDLDDDQLERYLNMNKIISEIPSKLQSSKKPLKDTSSSMIAETSLGNLFSSLSISDKSEESVQDLCLDFAKVVKQFERAVKTLDTQKEKYSKCELQLEKLNDFVTEFETIVSSGGNLNTETLTEEQEQKIISNSQAIADVLSIQKIIESFAQYELGDDFIENCDVLEPILDELLRNIS